MINDSRDSNEPRLYIMYINGIATSLPRLPTTRCPQRAP